MGRVTNGKLLAFGGVEIERSICGPAGFDILVIFVEASAPKVYPRVTLASARTISESVVRTLRGGEGHPNMFCLVASSLGHLRSQRDCCGSRFYCSTTSGSFSTHFSALIKHPK